MKKEISLFLLILSIFILIITPKQIAYAQELNDEQSSFINSIKDEAINGYKEYNILPSLTIAQAILESSWGKSSLSTEANNLFGVKAFSDWTGDTYTIATKEYSSSYGGYIYIDAIFKAYTTPTESIKDHNELLSTERYASVRSANNYVDACNAILDCGYATSPSYSDKLIQIIECYSLNQYDVLPTETVTEIGLNEQASDNKVVTDPILKTALDKKYKDIEIFKDTDLINKDKDKNKKEDTNNIPDATEPYKTEDNNTWYVIYCLLQNYCPDLNKIN